MNARTKTALQFLLSLPGAWDKEGKLKYSQVLHDLADYREVTYYDEWYWPKAARCFRLIKALNIYPGAEWEKLNLGYQKETVIDWSYNLDPENDEEVCLPDLFDCMFFDEIQVTWQEWIDMPSQDEIMALGIRPPLVWEKVNQDSSVQPSMF